jgi:hypothetical protein
MIQNNKNIIISTQNFVIIVKTYFKSSRFIRYWKEVSTYYQFYETINEVMADLQDVH